MSENRPGFTSQVGSAEPDGGVAVGGGSRREQQREATARERIERARTASSSTSSILDDRRVRLGLIGGTAGLVTGMGASFALGVDPVVPAAAAAVAGGGTGVAVAELGVGATTLRR